jgi:hypothetical protein
MMSVDIPFAPNSLRSNSLDRTIRLRPALARQIDLLLADVDHPRLSRGPRTLTRPAVARAASGSLTAIAAMLRDERHHVTREAADALHALLRDGASSPLYGDDPLAAALAAADVEATVRGGTAGAA